MAQFAGGAGGAGEQRFVEHDAGAHADAAADVDERVVGGTPAELDLADRGQVGFVVAVHRHVAQPGELELARQPPAHLHLAPADVGSELQHAAGRVHGTGQADAHAQQPRAGLRHLRGLGGHHLHQLVAGAVGRTVGQRRLVDLLQVAVNGGAHHADAVGAEFGADQREALPEQPQRRGTPPERAMPGSTSGQPVPTRRY